jgi:hypothetical protein
VPTWGKVHPWGHYCRLDTPQPQSPRTAAIQDTASETAVAYWRLSASGVQELRPTGNGVTLVLLPARHAARLAAD